EDGIRDDLVTGVQTCALPILTPLDVTPPNVPLLASIPHFTKGTQNRIACSSQTASGATAYYAECALDSAFTSLQGTSGWIADTRSEARRGGTDEGCRLVRTRL